MNVPAARIDQVVRLLPSLYAPTVSHLYDRDWLAVETVVDNDQVRDLIPTSPPPARKVFWNTN